VTRTSPGTGTGLGVEAATRVGERVAAHVGASGAEAVRPGAERACPIAVRVPAPAAAWNGPTGHSQVQTRLVGGVAALAPPRIQARVPPRRITVERRITVQPWITGQARVTAVRAIRAAWFHRTALYRTLPPRMLLCGPPTSGTMPPVRTSVPAALTALVAIGAPAGVVIGRTIRAEVGVTSGDGPTPATVPERLRTAVAHAALTPPAATVTVPKSLHHGAPAQAPLPVRRGRSHWFTFRSRLPRACQPQRPAVRSGSRSVSPYQR
jgi:hypothetical protein